MAFVQKKKIEEKKVEAGAGAPGDEDFGRKQQPKVTIRAKNDGTRGMNLAWPKEAMVTDPLEELYERLAAKKEDEAQGKT